MAVPACAGCPTWWAAKWEHRQATWRRYREKATAEAPLLPPTPSTPQATLAVLTSPRWSCGHRVGVRARSTARHWRQLAARRGGSSVAGAPAPGAAL